MCTTAECKDIGIKKSEIVAKTPLLWFNEQFLILANKQIIILFQVCQYNLRIPGVPQKVIYYDQQFKNSCKGLISFATILCHFILKLSLNLNFQKFKFTIKILIKTINLKTET